MTIRYLVILGTSSQQHTRKRNHGAYLFRWNEEGLLFDPGEGTQRQFIFANVAPTCVTRIFISHFHGDHCLGLGSMLMRLNLDKVPHPVHCYYPASGQVYFERLRYGTIYHQTIEIIEHPVEKEGIVHEDAHFCIEARYLKHGVENLGWRITEPDRRKFERQKLDSLGIEGPLVRKLEELGEMEINGKYVHIDDVSWMRKGDCIAVVMDTLPCPVITEVARDARLFLCESTYLDEQSELAADHYHLTVSQAATLAKEANAHKLVLTHFSARYSDPHPFEKAARAIFPNTDIAEDFMVIPF